MKYEPIGEEVSVEGALVQAAQAIDFAGMIATEARDSERLLDAAEHWKTLADFIVALSDHEDKKNEDGKKVELPMGFQPGSVNNADNKEIIAEEEEIARDEQD